CWSAHFKLDSQAAPQGVGDCRAVRSQDGHIRHQGYVGVQGTAVLRQKRLQVGAADLLFALEDALYVDGQPAERAQVDFDGLDVDEKLSFVVGRAPAVEVVTAHGWL